MHRSDLWRFVHGWPVKSHYSSRDGGSVIKLRDRRPWPTACAATYQPIGAANPSLRLLQPSAHPPSVFRGCAGRRRIVTRELQMCSLSKKKKGFHDSRDFILQSIKTRDGQPPRTPRATRFWFCTLFQQRWAFLMWHPPNSRLNNQFDNKPMLHTRCKTFPFFSPCSQTAFLYFSWSSCSRGSAGTLQLLQLGRPWDVSGKNPVGRVVEAVSNNKNCPNWKKEWICMFGTSLKKLLLLGLF